MAIRSNAKLRPDLMSSDVQTVWIELTLPTYSVLVGGVYREWNSSEPGSVLTERDRLDVILDQAKSATGTSKRVLILGDFNLDTLRHNDRSYSRRSFLQILSDGMKDASLDYATTKATWKSYGKFEGEHRTSCLDHVYSAGLDCSVKVLEDATSDHRPVLANILVPSERSGTRSIKRRNFKAIRQSELETALQRWPSQIPPRWHHGCPHEVAPIKTIKVKTGKNLYLAPDTLKLMRERDKATGSEYRRIRNQVSSMVKRDKVRTNVNKLHQSHNDPKVLWRLANEAIGNSSSPLPASVEVGGIPTVNNAETATAMNDFYIGKIKKLREGLPPSQPPLSSWPKLSAPVIKGMKATEALGVDGIPVSVLKKGIEVLAGPIAHLVNRSLASGTVPTALKMSNVLPVFKGKGKPATDPASYRPICILPALSKVLETVVKSDLEDHLAKTEALPNTQFGFRKSRSTTAALATAHAKWLEAEQRGKVVGVLGFDLSAAFDTVNQLQLLPKLEKLGIAGTQLKWFHSYLTGGYQRVVWNGTESVFLPVEYGVRQGSILGPILYLVLVADVTSCVGVGNEDNSGYADDFFLWAVGDSLEEVGSLLESRADAFSRFAGGNGLVLNATKTQLMIGGNVHPSDEIEFLGVKFDTGFTTAPHNINVAKAAAKRAALISRLAVHLPRGKYLRQLAKGLMIGKISYAAAAVAIPRFDNECKGPNAAHRAVQVAINDAARSIVGCKRRDHIHIGDLLERAGLPSLNEVAAKAVAMETWKCFYSSDGGGGARNPIGDFVFPIPRRPMRSTTSVAYPLGRETATFACHAISVWNLSKALRSATTLHTARTAARAIGRSVPI
ncbi:Uncharacterized protein FKW44_016510 [Caligus rogercresseyi]|uniref:Reverse transcriptase domain-containing protein n=4 Tax=Caligus rogercresseyi TaxID=217165 RepID=A0A7T8K0G9_CALRO|nr:Uncharacterized protein FKW44_016510 [Caligus rogercresseyi]